MAAARSGITTDDGVGFITLGLMPMLDRHAAAGLVLVLVTHPVDR